MSKKSEYNIEYTLHTRSERTCKQSIHDQDKARMRVGQVFNYFNICLPPKAKVLDIGCGLGYFTEALNYAGLSPVGIDISEVAVQISCGTFPCLNFRCGSYPEDMDDSFDLIWAVDFSTINTFDIRIIKDFVSKSLQKLNPNGMLIIGWHTDFSGKMKENWAHWDIITIQKIKMVTGLSGPAIVQARYNILNPIVIVACRLLKKSAPIFFMLKRS